MEQFNFPFKEEAIPEEISLKMHKGRMPTIEEDEELTIIEGGRPVSKEGEKKAAEKALDEVLGKDRKKSGENKDAAKA